jgi:alpha-ketoglutarate-dependent taurine dioxygenase
MKINTSILPTIFPGFPVKIIFPKCIMNQFVEWYRANEPEIDKMLLKHGAILFKGVLMQDLDEFEYVVSSISSKFMDYKDGFSPRTKLTGNVYTSTEYDADFFISLHNELSFSNTWPSKLFFFCNTASEQGGETPIADCREIVKKLNKDILQRFEEKGVLYVRNLHGGNGLGPSWQQTYETNREHDVEEFCKKNMIEYKWTDNGGIRIIQRKPATIHHLVTGEKVWFNQIDQFHPCHLNEEIHMALQELYGHDDTSLPMYGAFGDWSSIPKQDIISIQSCVNDLMVKVKWEVGDLLMLDNVLTSHGRMPYAGKRRILVSMAC